MSAVREFFKKQCQWRMLGVKCEHSADFYLSCWRNERSILPLLLFRIFLFLLCLAIIIASIVLTVEEGLGATWPIFMTHWGLIVNTLTCGFAVAVSAKCFISGPIDSDVDSLPWYFPVFWIFYSIATTVSFFITIFYWSFLTGDPELDEDGVNYAVDPVLDIFIHSINSVATFLLVVTSSMPARLLHAIYPIVFSVIYLLFSLVFYAAGGVSPFSSNWIYPMLNWEQPGTTLLYALVISIFLVFLYGVVIGVTAARDAAARTCGHHKETLDHYEDLWRDERSRQSTERRPMAGQTDLGPHIINTSR